MNGSRTSPAGIASTPVSTASRSIPSVKFWTNQLARTTVAGTPDANRMSSQRRALASPRPESSTMWRTPASRATSVRRVMAASDPGAAMSGT